MDRVCLSVVCMINDFVSSKKVRKMDDAKLSKNEPNEAVVTDVFAPADLETISEDKENLAKRLDQILEVLNARIDTVKEQRKICNEMAVLAA